MWWLLCLLVAIATPLIVFLIARRVSWLREESARPCPQLMTGDWPSVGLIIPAAGQHPDMEDAIRSLLSQRYAGTLHPVVVTATEDEPAARLVQRLQKDYTSLRHSIAGKANGKCGQKNHNSLQAVRALGKSVDVYAFCDSTHIASPDFLQRLVFPIAAKQSSFSTGYHEVIPKDCDLVTLAYTMCVIFLRLLQAQPGLAQLWGGAMAMKRTAFEEVGIEAFWGTNVVDDCSLTEVLRAAKQKITLCPGALLRTKASHHHYDVWTAWLDRQILFLKFCVPGQWILLGLLAAVAVLAPLGSLFILFLTCIGKGSLFLIFSVLLFLALSALATDRLRPLVSHHVHIVRWIGAFILTCLIFFTSFCRTVIAKGILWHGIWYSVGKQGRVLSTNRNEQ